MPETSPLSLNGTTTMPVSADPLALLAACSPQRATASLRPLPAMARLAFRGREGAIGPAGEAFGVPLPREACRFTTGEGRAALWLGPDEWILLAPVAEAGSLTAAIEAATAGLPHSLVDVSSRSVGLEMSGPKAAFVLNQGCPLNLSLGRFPVGTCTRTLFHKAEIVLSRTSDDTFRVDVWRSFAPYVWSLLEEGRREID